MVGVGRDLQWISAPPVGRPGAGRIELERDTVPRQWTPHPALDILAGQVRQWLSAMIAQRQALGAVRTDLPARPVNGCDLWDA